MCVLTSIGMPDAVSVGQGAGMLIVAQIGLFTLTNRVSGGLITRIVLAKASFSVKEHGIFVERFRAMPLRCDLEI